MSHANGKNLRKGRVSQEGNIYLITTVTEARAPVFKDLYLARIAINSLRDLEQRGEVRTLAYTLMPDHLHWLLQLQHGELSNTVKRFKGVSARMLNQRRNQSGKVWQPAYHDHALRKEEDIRKTARYLIANPVRAGLVDSVAAYPHWDAVWINGGTWE